MMDYLRSRAQASAFKAVVAATVVGIYLDTAPDIPTADWATYVKEYLP
jgi:hypothetical protein